MTAPATLRRTAVLACAAALALTACSGTSDDESTGSTSSGDYQPGPLDEYMARIYGYSYDEAEQQSTEELQAESDRQNREVEELVASCMSEQGFDYTPADTNSGTVWSSDDLDIEWGSLEFAEQYGYGISTDPWGMEDAPVDENAYVDPNAEYVESMSESEQEAYSAALWGEPVEYVEGEEESYEYDWTTSGCYGAAQHEVYDSTATDVSGDYSALEDEMNARWERVSASSEMAELNAAWVSCMADAGVSGMTGVDAAQQGLYDEWSNLQGWNDPDYQAMIESWDWEAKPEGPAAPEIDATALADFTKKEITQAVADFGCKKDVDYEKRYTEIDHADQQEFVDQHRDELEAWAEAASQARGE